MSIQDEPQQEPAPAHAFELWGGFQCCAACGFEIPEGGEYEVADADWIHCPAPGFATRWIAIAERPPPLGQFVLVWCAGQPWRFGDATTHFARVMARQDFDERDGRSPGWQWVEVGPMTMRHDEIALWAPLTEPSA